MQIYFKLCTFVERNGINILNMETALLSSESKSDMQILMQLAKKLGVKVKSLSEEEIEDWVLAKRIDAGMKSGKATREQVMKALET